MKETYTLKEAAALLQAHPETVRRWARTGKLKAFKAQGYRFSRSDLEAFWRSKGGGELLERADGRVPISTLPPLTDEDRRRVAKQLRFLAPFLGLPTGARQIMEAADLLDPPD